MENEKIVKWDGVNCTMLGKLRVSDGVVTRMDGCVCSPAMNPTEVDNNDPLLIEFCNTGKWLFSTATDTKI